MEAGARPASSSVMRITACCAGPLGAVSVLLRPPWLTAVPASSTTQPPAAACASSRIGCMSRVTTASPRT